ncbi:ribosomal small subunit pseudouridine synthase A [Ruminococcaceae bacterium KH2T8]|nr:ribosomal small subunit pseudouridine synthase A [Ruminococcaceae bacterium KH2T8]
MRLDRLLANSGCGTRNEIRVLIKKGKVTVNGQTVTDPSVHVSESDDISIAGETTRLASKLYYMFDKPDNVLTAMEDKRLPTVSDFIPANLKHLKLSPVGRLDYHSTGLLIITNDGELSHRLTSPKYEIPKLYRVRYEGTPITDADIKETAEGVTLTDMDTPVKLKPSKMVRISDDTCEITLYEGKTHEIRRLMAHFEKSVIELRRIKIGDLSLPEDSVPGTLTRLTDEQTDMLLKATGIS